MFAHYTGVEPTFNFGFEVVVSFPLALPVQVFFGLLKDVIGQ
jgi:hypothetical protein